MQIKRARVVETTVEDVRDVPEYFFDGDDTLRGRIVDVLVEGTGMKRNGRNRRLDLHDEEIAVIDGAINDLTRAYEQADKIIAAVKQHAEESAARRDRQKDKQRQGGEE